MSEHSPKALPSAGRPYLYDRVHRGRIVSAGLAMLAVTICVASGVVIGLMLDLLVIFPLACRPAGLERTDPASLLVMPKILGLAGLVFSLPLVVLAWVRSRKIVLRETGGRAVREACEREFDNIVAEIAIAAGIPRPSTAIVDIATPNALSVGSRRDSTIVVTSGALELLDRAQLQAIVAHEIAHILRGDTRIGGFFVALAVYLGRLQVTFASAVAFFSTMSVLLAAPRLLFVGVAARFLRERDYTADDTGILLCRDPQAMIDALEAIASFPDPLRWVSRDTEFLGFVGPEDPAADRARWTDSHPPLRSRVARLRLVSD